MTQLWIELQRDTGAKFNDVALLQQAFTHTSYRNEHKRSAQEDNERLEFLGDAVLELLVSDDLYAQFPQLPEGELTRLRASIVCETSLVRFAKKLSFHRYVRLGKGEERSGGRERPALLADVFEAFIGALYLDQGLLAARQFVRQHVLDDSLLGWQQPDYKTTLQEQVQGSGERDLRYEIVDERGPAHAREFVAHVLVGTQIMGEGTGKSKKEAEQNAASFALDLILQQANGGRQRVSETD